MVVPDLFTCSIVKMGIIQLYVNPRFEGFVKMANAVGGKKQDTLVIVERAKKDWIDNVRYSSPAG